MKVIVLLGNCDHDTEFLGVFVNKEALDKYFEDNPELEYEYTYGFNAIESEVIE